MKNEIKPVLAIGIDAGEPDLIERWCREGKLPAIASLMYNGSYSRIKSFADFSSGVSWSTFSTGVNPAKHGIFYYHRQLISGTYNIEKKYAKELKSDMFWSFNNHEGKRITVFDVPETYPVNGLKGIQVVNWGCEGVNWESSSWPPGLYKDIVSQFGTSPINNLYQTKSYNTYKKCEELYTKLSKSVKIRTAILENLIDRGKWDLFMPVFTESHWAGHHLWHTLEESNQNYIAEYTKPDSSPVFKIYREIDSSISRLIKRFPDSIKIIFSVAGMGPNLSGSQLIPQILERLGYSEMKSNNNNSFKQYLKKKWGPYAVRTIEDTIPTIILEKARQLIPNKIWDQGTRKITTLGNNWEKSKAFWIPNGHIGAIRINLKGREPKGIVEPGKEYDNLCNNIIEEFKKLINTETGNSAVSEAIRIDKTFSGDYLHNLPDIIIRWTEDAAINSLYSDSTGKVTGSNPDRRSGGHKPYGFIIANGVYIKTRVEINQYDIMDIAPTIIYLMGLPVSRHLDGKIMSDLITDKFKASHPPQYA